MATTLEISTAAPQPVEHQNAGGATYTSTRVLASVNAATTSTTLGHMNQIRAAQGLMAAMRGFALSLFVVVVIIHALLLVLGALSISLIPVGVGIVMTPVAAGLVRRYTQWRRRLAADWFGVTIPSPYQTSVETLRSPDTGVVQRCLLVLRDPATWRDLVWLFLEVTAGLLLAITPFLMLLWGLFGVVLAAGVWMPITDAIDTFWYGFVPVNSFFTSLLAGAVGVVAIVLSLRLAPVMLQIHTNLTTSLLAPTKEAALAQRVEKLTETRHDAVDSAAAELRRIERDLHDGAQARLVAMGMNLGAVEGLIESDPERARRLLADVRANSAEALNELRDLVHGIHPPVLAERGLGDAVRALALRLPVPVDVDVDLPGRFDEPVETATYFAVSEVLTNAVKHAGGDRIWVDLDYTETTRMLRATVTDNGNGGADPSGGTGLQGAERRLGQFDGILAISSPAGGPTVVTIQVPATLL